jgi:SNF2 family DNA or RNA helicase
LEYLRQIGLGACLADDMGLGKTVELITFLLREREHELDKKDSSIARLPPALLICPMSVAGNWQKELKRFATGLRVLVHHGQNRHTGLAFQQEAAEKDVVITTYALARRDDMVQRFQAVGSPIFILSLKAGGSGLNLTAASLVYHFDRLWNPAVENQATDRTFRIGQKKNVFVHKFVCLGTLEERIDRMMEQKKALAESIIGTGESWLTELSNEALRDMLSLRRDAVSSEDDDK